MGTDSEYYPSICFFMHIVTIDDVDKPSTVSSHRQYRNSSKKKTTKKQQQQKLKKNIDGYA